MSSSGSHYDCIVVGAGPAGSAFAKAVSDTGLSVLLIDGALPGRSKPCGGLLAPDAQKLFARFDYPLPHAILADPQIFSVRVIDLGRNMERRYRRSYVNMHRDAFDAYLLSLVPDSVTVLKGRCLDCAACEGGYRVRVRAMDTGEEQDYTCARLVGADGAGSIVRRTFFGNGTIPRYVAIQGWYRPMAAVNPYYSCVFDPETSDSCSWTLFKNGYMIYGGAFPEKDCRRAFDAQKERLEAYLGYSFGEAERIEACPVCSPRRFKHFRTSGRGDAAHVYLIGEAAGFISASSFEGISSAIQSGLFLADAFRKKDPGRAYRRKTRTLRFRLRLKGFKRIATHTPWIRRLLMKTGISAIRTI